MRFRSLLRPRHKLAWHCSTARIGSLPTHWPAWFVISYFIGDHRKSSHHWPRRKHAVSKLHMWYTPLKKCYQAMWAWSFRQTVISVWQAKSLQPQEYRLMMYRFVYNYIQLHTITHNYIQLHTITHNYTQLRTITNNYKQLHSITFNYCWTQTKIFIFLKFFANFFGIFSSAMHNLVPENIMGKKNPKKVQCRVLRHSLH